MPERNREEKEARASKIQKKTRAGRENIAMNALFFSVREQVTPTIRKNGKATIL